jgi:hypothetical protein
LIELFEREGSIPGVLRHLAALAPLTQTSLKRHAENHA